MMPMDPKKLINRFSWKRSPSAVFSCLHKIHFAYIIMVGFRVHGHICNYSSCDEKIFYSKSRLGGEKARHSERVHVMGESLSSHHLRYQLPNNRT